LGDTLVALTRDQMLWRDPRTDAWTLGPNLSTILGGLVAFVPDGPGFWVAGEQGVGFARLGTPPVLPLRQGDLPGTANDLAVDSEFLWVATSAGLVRFRLAAVRPCRPRGSAPDASSTGSAASPPRSDITRSVWVMTARSCPRRIAGWWPAPT